MNLHRVIIQAIGGLWQLLKMCPLRVLIRLRRNYKVFHRFPRDVVENSEDLCVANCVGSETYVGGLLTFMRSCDSLPAKTTRTQRLFREHKHSKAFTQLHFFSHFFNITFPQLFPHKCTQAVENVDT